MAKISPSKTAVKGAARKKAVVGYAQPAQPVCALCGARRRDYLFVIGQTRMTRCHECGLVSRSESAAAYRADSFALDADSERALRASVLASARAGAKVRLLQVVRGENPAARLLNDDAIDVTTVVIDADDSAGDAIKGTFDAAFVNGVADFLVDPVALLKRVRAHLAPGGTLVIIGASDLAATDERLLPRHLYAAPQLIRLAMTSGWKPQACGLLSRRPGTSAPDERLRADLPFGPVHRALERFGQATDVPSGLIFLCAKAEDLPGQPKLSVVMPVFNEAATFLDTFEKVHAAEVAGVTRELIIVESNSTDGTRELVRSIEARPGVQVIYEDRPRGKGFAVRAGLAAATGDFLLIQDADSEYDVADYDIVLEPLLQMRATFVLGSRHLGARTWKIRQFGDAKSISLIMNFAHEGFTALANALYDTSMHDPATMYKVFRRECFHGIDFRRDRFDFDWEFVCKMIRRGHVPVEVPINYKSRSYSEGKKVRFFRDPGTWLSTIVASRFERLTKD